MALPKIKLTFEKPKLKLPEETSGIKRFLRLGVILPIVIVGVITFLVALRFDFSLPGSLIFAYLWIALYFSISSRIAAAFALALLASCPVLLWQELDETAELAAVYAYYFLVVVLIQEIFLMVKETYSKKTENSN